MKNDDMDRWLSKDPGIVPSSGFVLSVMDAVRSEASTPPPLRFPWKLALPGFVAAIVIIGFVLWTGLVQALHTAGDSQSTIAVPSAVLWTALALLTTLASLLFSMRLAGPKA
jgi:hypothetical protein